MKYESVSAPYTCPQCNASQKIVHALSFDSTGVRSASSFTCLNCGSSFEADDRGVPPEWKPLFYAANGHWELIVVNAGLRKVDLLRKLREVLGLELAATSALSRRIPGRIADGTRVEMEFLKCELQSLGAVMEVVSIKSGGD
ncbi:hypothetical protein [Pyxidicoccus xibeiensis]|uniref:hypothetical protein n=1 Tax=Pyxidicoccus xibeiensis TaxID=2906759 RepID=UPI0020A7F6E9|nr:hypothetical protein [Pyxidicoccus xibeiensis]MCP3143130.1 hypothetical protein [Pyxidicoccus xibeiensis]